MRFIVIGPAQAGKTTLSRMLANHLGTVATDTSEAIVKIETERQRLMGEAPATEARGWFLDAWDTARNRPARKNLIALGDALKVVDETILARYCFDRGNVCSGVRRKTELDAVLKAYPGSHVVMVVARDVVEDNFDIGPNDIPGESSVIWNGKQSLAVLDEQAAAVARAWGTPDDGR